MSRYLLRRKRVNGVRELLHGILENERYCGDVILQKTYITDPISNKVKKNNGELPKVYIKNNHDPMVDHNNYPKLPW